MLLYSPFQTSPPHRNSRRNFISLPGNRHIKLALKPNYSNTATRKELKKMLRKARALEVGATHHPQDSSSIKSSQQLHLDEQPHIGFLLSAQSSLVLAHCWRSLPNLST
jgi:hypothetical protein